MGPRTYPTYPVISCQILTYPYISYISLCSKFPDVLLLDLEGSGHSSVICFSASLTSAVGSNDSNQGAFGPQNRCISLSSSGGRLRLQLKQGGSANGNDGEHPHLELGSNLWPSFLVFFARLAHVQSDFLGIYLFIQ
jgi:hypothetical protein